MGLRDIILWIVGALLVYLAWLMIRLLASSRKKKPSLLSELPPSSPGQGSTIQSRIVGNSLSKAYSSDVFDGDDDELDSLPAVKLDHSDRRIPVPPAPDAGSFGFDALLEVRNMRHLLDDLQQRYSDLQAGMEEMRREVGELKAASQVSPFYGEAVALARRGYDAQAIAERCGISVAEAEMVCSLSKSAGSTEE